MRISSSLLIVLALILGGCIRDSVEPTQVKVILGAQIEDMPDIDWPVNSGKYSSLHAIERPIDLVVVFPNGDVWNTPSHMTIMKQSGDICSSISICPLQDALAIDEVNAAINSILMDLRITDRELLAKLSMVGSQPPHWEPTASVLAIGRLDETEVAIRIKPSTATNKWYFSVEFLDIKQFSE